MALQFTMKKDENNLKPRIVVIGIGGAGGNAVNNMIRSNLEGVEFLVCNTDAQSLGQSLAERRIQLGTGITKGLGSGARPEIGQAAAEESLGEIMTFLLDAHMVFITAGMGGGTGTGAAPIIAQAAREQGILTVGVVTKPFQFEGQHRMNLAEAGVEELQQYVDTLIMIPNQNLFRLANEKTTFADAFKMADDVLYSGVRGVTDLMVMPGLINLDFADIRTVMGEMGKAMMGTGEADSDKRAIDAAEAAISNPLLDDVSMRGAKGVLINITGGMDLTLFEVDEAANRIREEVDPEANIIFGSTFDESLEGKMRVSVVATGIESMIMAATPRSAQQSLNQTGPKLTEITAGQLKSPTALHKPQPTFQDTVGLAARTLQKPKASPEPSYVNKAHFIPSPSVSPDDVARDGAHPDQSKNNTTPATSKPKSTSLFKKIMGAGGSHDTSGSTDDGGKEEKPLPLRDTAIARDEAVRKVPQESSQSQEKEEEDVLDVPAFLRRQAN